jgi:response regulator RpfG family c-di-GMP phosphodiesterase
MGLAGIFFDFNSNMEINQKTPVIIVEHDRALRVLYRTALTSLKIMNPLLFFDNGNDLLRCADNLTETPCMILSNASLPRMRGWELKAKLNELDNSASAAPFVLLCESCSAGDQAYARMMGVDIILTENDNYEQLKLNFEQMLRSAADLSSSAKFVA